MQYFTVAIADDHVLFAESLSGLIFSNPSYIPSFSFSGGTGLQSLVGAHLPDILILDIQLPPQNGLELIAPIRAVSPGTKILILSMHQPEEFRLDIDSFMGDGYVLKTSGKEVFEAALKEMTKPGGKYFSPDIKWYQKKEQREEASEILLTRREKEIIRMISEGMTSRAIAEALSISEHTVKTHRSRIREKMNVKGIAQLINKLNQ